MENNTKTNILQMWDKLRKHKNVPGRNKILGSMKGIERTEIKVNGK